MKKLYLILLLSSLHSIANAAEGQNNITTGIPIGGGGFPHFDPQVGSKISSNNHFRLIAKTNTFYNGFGFEPIDSNTYKYGTGRGSVIDPDQPNIDEFILFDEAITHFYNSSIQGYQNKLRRYQTFDNVDKIKSLTYARWNSVEWKDSSRYLYTYVPGTSKIDVSLFQLYIAQTWSHDLPSQLTYSGNNVQSINSLDYSATYDYDANNNIISIIDKVSPTHGSGALVYNQRKSFTYTVTNDVETYMIEKWDAGMGTWMKFKLMEYTYIGKNIETITEYKWNGTAWVKDTHHTYTYNTNNDQLTEIIKVWNVTTNQFVEYTLETRDYNAYGLVEAITVIGWDNNSSTWKYNSNSKQIRYYYEYYNPTSINQVANNNSIKIFPNPGRDIINITADMETAQKTDIKIYNAIGVCVYSSPEPAAQILNKQLNLSSFPTGTYMLCIAGENTSYTNKLLINR